MADIEKAEPQDGFLQVFDAASRLPGVRIDREKYLAGALGPHFSPEVVELAVATSPAQAGIEPDRLAAIANGSIKFETAKVTAISAASGIPGGLAMLGTIPADTAQYFAHVIRIAQKLAYLYGWSELVGEEDEMDDEARGILILFMGVMFGAKGAGEGIGKISAQAAKVAMRRIPQKTLAELPLYRVLVKPIARQLGVQMNKEIFAKGVGKVIPVVGAIASGGITLATYAPMCYKLKNYLAGLELADPQTYVIDIEDVGESDEGFEE